MMSYNVYIMMSRTQIMLESEAHRRARRRASDLGISLAEYIRRLVARDIAVAAPKADVTSVFDLGSSTGSDIARNKDAMVGEAFYMTSRKRRAR
jgi:hypothetical protein